MDQEDELQRFKFALFAFVAVLVSGYISWGEMKYKVWGKSADATVTQAREEERRGRRGRRYRVLVVDYTFTEADGTRRSERDEVSSGTEAPNPTAPVQYLPGVANSSRLAGQENYIAVIIFFGSPRLDGIHDLQHRPRSKCPDPAIRQTVNQAAEGRGCPTKRTATPKPCLDQAGDPHSLPAADDQPIGRRFRRSL